jgi:hypothetical protein
MWLEQCGLRVLRCSNEELYNNFDGLLDAIFSACRSRTPLTTPHPRPLSPRRRGARGVTFELSAGYSRSPRGE